MVPSTYADSLGRNSNLNQAVDTRSEPEGQSAARILIPYSPRYDPYTVVSSLCQLILNDRVISHCCVFQSVANHAQPTSTDPNSAGSVSTINWSRKSWAEVLLSSQKVQVQDATIPHKNRRSKSVFDIRPLTYDRVRSKTFL